MNLLDESNRCRISAKEIFEETNRIIERAKKTFDLKAQTELYKQAMSNNEKGFALEAKARALYEEYLKSGGDKENASRNQSRSNGKKRGNNSGNSNRKSNL